MPEIKNPISLARLVLNHTTQSLTLRRVPPNLLVAQGAIEFADEMGVPVLPHDALISPAAHERWLRWKTDLRVAEKKARKTGAHPSCWRIRTPRTTKDEEEEERLRMQHTRNLLQGYPHLAQPMSPIPSEDSIYYAGEETSATPSDPSAPQSDISMGSSTSEECMTMPESATSTRLLQPPSARPLTVEESSRSAFINSTQKLPTLRQFKDSRALRDITAEHIAEDTAMRDSDGGPIAWGDGSDEDTYSASSTATIKPSDLAMNIPLPDTPPDKHIECLTPPVATPLEHVKETAPLPPKPASPPTSRMGEEDCITDTVGAIAVDGWGNIACAASSGGIGMKYRGRVGPAALVGVGTAVVPIDPDDLDGTCVATVTSGTGEHMATTMAATTCAERLYQSIKKGKGGEYVEVTEDEAMRSMIENDFMGKRLSTTRHFSVANTS